MTREEAIEEIKKLEYYGRPFDNSLEECNKASRKVMALNMAIKALEQEPKKSCNTMDFSNTFDEFAKGYGFKDSKEVYTNGADLIPVFRVKQWLEHIEPSGDLISRKEVINQIFYSTDNNGDVALGSVLRRRIENLPSVNPQEPKTGHWITVTNGRGGHECSLCHEYAPSYQNGDEWLTNYCPNCGAKMESEDKE